MAYDFASGTEFDNSTMNNFNLAINNRYNAPARNSLINTINRKTKAGEKDTWILKTYDGKSDDSAYGEFIYRESGDFPNTILASSLTDNILGFEQASSSGLDEYLLTATRDKNISAENLKKLANIDLFENLES